MSASEKSGLHRPWHFNRLGTLTVVVGDIVHPSTDGITSHLLSIIGLEHLGGRCQVSKSGIKPQVITRGRKDLVGPQQHEGDVIVLRSVADKAI